MSIVQCVCVDGFHHQLWNPSRMIWQCLQGWCAWLICCVRVGVVSGGEAVTCGFWFMVHWDWFIGLQVLGFDLLKSGIFSVLPWITMAVFANVGGWLADTMVSKGVSVTRVRKIMQTVRGEFVNPFYADCKPLASHSKCNNSWGSALGLSCLPCPSSALHLPVRRSSINGSHCCCLTSFCNQLLLRWSAMGKRS